VRLDRSEYPYVEQALRGNWYCQTVTFLQMLIHPANTDSNLPSLFLVWWWAVLVCSAVAKSGIIWQIMFNEEYEYVTKCELGSPVFTFSHHTFISLFIENRSQCIRPQDVIGIQRPSSLTQYWRSSKYLHLTRKSTTRTSQCTRFGTTNIIVIIFPLSCCDSPDLLQFPMGAVVRFSYSGMVDGLLARPNYLHAMTCFSYLDR
jgi:hypothetical protein